MKVALVADRTFRQVHGVAVGYGLTCCDGVGCVRFATEGIVYSPRYIVILYVYELREILPAEERAAAATCVAIVLLSVDGVLEEHERDIVLRRGYVFS